MALNLSGVYTDIKVDGAQNEITAETVQGEITVLGGAGNVSLKSVMGAVTLEKARGRIDLSSVNEERSEERRVGKEWRSRWEPQEKIEKRKDSEESIER